MILDRNAPCNQGEEPFCEFLFKTYDRDSAFIKERFKLDKAFYGGNNPPEPYLEPYLPLGLIIVKSEKVLFFTEENHFGKKWRCHGLMLRPTECVMFMVNYVKMVKL